VDRKDSQGYTTRVDISITPVNFASSVVDQAPGFTDLTTPITMQGSVTNTTPGRSAPSFLEWGVLAGYPSDSPACLLADPKSPILQQYKGLPGKLRGAHCYFEIHGPMLQSTTIPVGGTATLTSKIIGSNLPKPHIDKNAMNLTGVPESRAEVIRAALNSPSWYALVSGVNYYSDGPVKCTWEFGTNGNVSNLHILDATRGFTC
jgi:hypothetical protein